LVREVGWSIGETADHLNLDLAQVEAATEYYDDNLELVKTNRVRKQYIAAKSHAE